VTEFDRYTLVLLRWPRDMREFADEELERSQAGHLAFLEQMHDEGHLVLSGPLDDQPDERLRGISLYRTSLEETTRLLAGDTAVPAPAARLARGRRPGRLSGPRGHR